MAQDFGDDIGEALVRAAGRGIGRLASRYLEQRVRDWHAQLGMNPETAADDSLCIPFGSTDDAAYFTRVCHDNDVPVLALADKKGNGYLFFSKENLERVKSCIPQFSEVMTVLKNQEITESLANAKPLTAEQLSALQQVGNLPDLPTQTKEPAREPSPEQAAHLRDDRAGDAYNHTAGIRDKVLTARGQCRNFDDFREILAKEGVGITNTKDGELMYYEARFGNDGRLLPCGRNEQGLHDWAVSAKTLANDRWKCEATNDWFAANTPKEPSIPQKVILPQKDPQLADGSKDMDGSTPDIDQGIESHDGRDTMTSTFRMEYEASSSGDVPPSEVREQGEARSHDDGRGYSLNSAAKEARAASRQLEKESGITERDIDISDKLNPVR